MARAKVAAWDDPGARSRDEEVARLTRDLAEARADIARRVALRAEEQRAFVVGLEFAQAKAAEAIAEARADERAAIVAWLRPAMSFRVACDNIERGIHHQPQATRPPLGMRTLLHQAYKDAPDRCHRCGKARAEWNSMESCPGRPPQGLVP